MGDNVRSCENGKKASAAMNNWNERAEARERAVVLQETASEDCKRGQTRKKERKDKTDRRRRRREEGRRKSIFLFFPLLGFNHGTE